MTEQLYSFRPIGDASGGFDLRPYARVLMNAIEDIEKYDPEGLKGYLCLEIMSQGYGQKEAIEEVMVPNKRDSPNGPRARLGAQVCEACVKYWGCKERIAPPLSDIELSQAGITDISVHGGASTIRGISSRDNRSSRPLE